MKFLRFCAVCAPLFALPVVCLMPASAVHAQAVVKMPNANMSFVPPTGYQLIDRKQLPAQAQQATFAYRGPVVSGFAANVNLMMQAHQPGVKADVASAEMLVGVLKKSNPTYKRVGTGALTVGGENASFLSGTFTMSGHAIQNKQVLVVHGDKQYIFTFSAAPTAYAKQVGAFDAMLASLKWQ